MCTWQIEDLVDGKFLGAVKVVGIENEFKLVTHRHAGQHGDGRQELQSIDEVVGVRVEEAE
jgi:hypothetical protein